MNPDEWEVGVVWLTRRLRRPDRMLGDRMRAAAPPTSDDRSTSAAAPPTPDPDPAPPESGGRPARWYDHLDGCIPDELALVVLGAVLGFLVGPVLLALVVGAAELVLLVVVAALVPVVRIVLRQPWEIVARRGGREATWRIRGLRSARELRDHVEAALRLGHDPDVVAPDHRDDAPPPSELVPRLYGAADFRFLGRVLGVLLGIGATVALVAVLALIT